MVKPPVQLHFRFSDLTLYFNFQTASLFLGSSLSGDTVAIHRRYNGDTLVTLSLIVSISIFISLAWIIQDFFGEQTEQTDDKQITKQITCHKAQSDRANEWRTRIL